jgi:multidrug efflux pump subunit AcrB
MPIDFIELRLAEGMPLDAAVIGADALRFRPMMLTAAAVVVGSSVICSIPYSRNWPLRSWRVKSPPCCSRE